MLVVTEDIKYELDRANQNLPTIQYMLARKKVRNIKHDSFKELETLSTVLYAHQLYLSSDQATNLTNPYVQASMMTLRYANDEAEKVIGRYQNCPIIKEDAAIGYSGVYLPKNN